MKIKEARRRIKEFGAYHALRDLPHSAYTVEAFETADAIMEKAQLKQEADGCQGCAFTDVEEWEMPCRKCQRSCKDYWRPAKK